MHGVCGHGDILQARLEGDYKMDVFINLIYVADDPILTIVKLVFVCMCLELFAVACAFLGGVR